MPAAVPPGPLGILSGGGGLPAEIADTVIASGRAVHIVALDGEADSSIERFPHTWVNWGGIGAMLAALRGNGCREMIIVGAVSRPNLARLRPDLGFFTNLPQLVKFLWGGDDAILRRVVRFFEASGIVVLGVPDVAPHLLADAAAMGACAPAPNDLTDIAAGVEALAALGRFDLGQAAIAAGGRLIELEGADGTDAMLRRLATDRPPGTRGGTLVKLPKPGQEMRVDLPTIGPRTIELASAAGLSGIAVAAGATLVADRRATLAAADSAGLFVTGVERPAANLSARPRGKRGKGSSPGEVASDAEVARDLLRELERYREPCAAVVSRRYVLAVETAARAERALDRARRSKPWGLKALQTRIGVLAVSARSDALTPALVTKAAESGLAAVVANGATPAQAAILEAAAAASRIALIQEDRDDAGPGRPLRVFIVAGEHSGDALGGKLMHALRARQPDLVFAGVGGEHMAQAGLDSLFPMADIAVMGPIAIARQIRPIVRRVYQTIDAAVAFEPDVLVVIDAPEFCHAVAKRVRKRRPDIPIVDYVSPTVWAWRPGRAKAMRPYTDHLLALLPFEPAAHERLGGPPCTYVGHPLIEKLPWLRGLDADALARRLQLDPARPVLCVLPGSRRSEVGRLMDVFGDTVRRLDAMGPPPELVLPVVPSVRALVEDKLAAWPRRPYLVDGEDDKWRAMKLARAALAASGTVTLELALAGAPMVVAYKVEPLVAPVLRRLIKGETVVLANLVLGRNVFPEYLQEDCTPEHLADALAAAMAEGPSRARQRDGLGEIAQRLALPNGSPSEVAARIVLDYASS